ncbi:MAG: cytochrome oxidase putative small subunit CydP [Steroidobacteraceae bacterium]
MTWRRAFRRHLTLLLLAKFAALALLWALCFSPAHRTFVDGEVEGRRLALVQPHAPARPAAPPLEENTRD